MMRSGNQNQTSRRRQGYRTDNALLGTDHTSVTRRNQSETHTGSTTLTVESAPSSPAKSPGQQTYANVVAGRTVSNDSPERSEANVEDELGPNHQPLRGIPGYQNQQQTHARNAVNPGRVPNTKLGNSSNWAFGLPPGGQTPTGLQNIQTRNVGAAPGSFAQSVSGSQPATPLDLSEFPSLSGVPQSQQQNPGQAIWANARVAQQGNTSRQQQPTQSHTPQLPNHQQSRTPHQDLFPSGQQFADGLDEFRHGASGIGSQLSSTQPQPSNIEEFPPLGRDAPPSAPGLNQNQAQEKRSDLMSNNGAFAGFGSIGFPSQNQQQRNPLSNPQDQITSPVSTVLSNVRSPIPQGQNGMMGGDKLSAIGSENQRRHDDFGHTQDRAQPSGQEQPDAFSGTDISVAGLQEQQSLSQMSPNDKWGLPGLLAMIRHPSQDIANLVIGHDLTNLGLDLNSTEPLHPNFATPFAPSTATRPLETDYTLPSCYTVANVQPLHERIPSFSEETLFYIFYTRPRDIMQELVADELMGRKWRYHKIEKMWVTRDETFPNPVEVEPRVSERGVYVWWDYEGWKRIRRDYLLRYEDLDDRSSRLSAANMNVFAGQLARG